MVIKSKIGMIFLQSPEGLEFNFLYNFVNRVPLLLKNYSILVTPNNPNKKEPISQVKIRINVF